MTFEVKLKKPALKKSLAKQAIAKALNAAKLAARVSVKHVRAALILTIISITAALASTACLAQVPEPQPQPQIQLKLEGDVVQYVRKLPVAVVAPEGYDMYDWKSPMQLLVSEEDSGKLIIEKGAAGTYRISLKASKINWEAKKVERVVTHIDIQIGLPGPVDPDPVDPDDPDNPPDPNTKVTRVTYVYEKDDGATPRAVASALNKINAAKVGILASEFEEDQVDGFDETPDQYKVALAAARTAGLPAVVIQAGTKVLKVIKSPTTESQVLEAVNVARGYSKANNVRS